jgi:hypothetical protein
MAVNYWTEQMDTDSELVAAQQKLDAFNEQIERFVSSAVGGKPREGERWF